MSGWSNASRMGQCRNDLYRLTDTISASSSIFGSKVEVASLTPERDRAGLELQPPVKQVKNRRVSLQYLDLGSPHVLERGISGSYQNIYRDSII